MDQRKVERTIACDRVSYRVGDTTAREPLRNLSVNGCQIGGALGQFGKGDPIEVTLIDGISVVGVVAWKRDDEFGVAFDRPISDVTVRPRMLNVARSTCAQSGSRRALRIT